MIEPGWRVEAADGTDAGRVLEVKPRYVPAEQVAEIVDGRVRLRLDRGGIERLTEFKQPAEEDRIEPEAAPLTSRIETGVATPSTRRSSIPLVRRVLLWFGLAGRR